MVHMGLTGQYFSEVDLNNDGSRRAADPTVQARKLVSTNLKLSESIVRVCLLSIPFSFFFSHAHVSLNYN